MRTPIVFALVRVMFPLFGRAEAALTSGQVFGKRATSAFQKQPFQPPKATFLQAKSRPLALLKQPLCPPVSPFLLLLFYSFTLLLLNDYNEMGDDIAHYNEQHGRTNYLKPSATHFLPFYFFILLPFHFPFYPFTSLPFYLYNLPFSPFPVFFTFLPFRFALFTFSLYLCEGQTVVFSKINRPCQARYSITVDLLYRNHQTKRI